MLPTKEELEQVRNHVANLPSCAPMYIEVLIRWCEVLLDEVDKTEERTREEVVDLLKGYSTMPMSEGAQHLLLQMAEKVKQGEKYA